MLKRDGYAGLTMAKVASASGQNKALIAYYFGSKEGLVAAVARAVAEEIVSHMVAAVSAPRRAEEMVRRLTEGAWSLMDRDEGLQRIYFDLTSQSVVEPRVSAIMIEMKEGFRAVMREFLRSLEDGPDDDDLGAAAVYLIAGVEGLMLERLDRGESPELSRAREIFIASASAAIRGRGTDRTDGRAIG